jgi:hypothetical protein
MLRPLIDKISFADKCFAAGREADVFVDYGCADGAILDVLARIFPSRHYVGFDISDEMVALARKRLPRHVPVTASWDEVVSICQVHRDAERTVCLVINSVHHEAENYLNADELRVFHDRTWGRAGFAWDAIAFRDMMVNRATSRPSDPLAVALVRQRFDQDRLSQWEQQWGSINENWSLVSFFLHYRYEDNWARELREDYLPKPLEDFMSSVPR